MYNTLYLFTTLHIYVQHFIFRKTSFSSQNYFYEYSIFYKLLEILLKYWLHNEQ